MMPGTARVRARIAAVLAVAGLLVATVPALAAGSNMPWEQPLQQILQSIEGPVTKIIAVIIIIVTGLSLAFGDAGGGFRRLIQIVFGLSIAFAASSFFLSFFSFGGGALI
jgi:type IV secretion system protein VirB2